MTHRQRHVVVVGLMGTGKTTVGQRVAELLGRRFRDSDADIEAARGRSARQIAEAGGIEALHRTEHDHLLTALAEPVPAVVAAAASVADDAECLAALERAFVAWLELGIDEITHRQSSGDHRRLLEPDPAGSLREQLGWRAPAFARVSDLRVDVGDADAEEAAAEVVRAARAAGAA